jgi:hypothetical protein
VAPGLMVSSKCRPLVVINVAPGLMVSSKCRPLVVINVAGTEGLLEGVFETLLRYSSGTVASGEFAIQCYIGEAVVIHSGDDVPCSVQLRHHQHGLDATDLCFLENLNVGC